MALHVTIATNVVMWERLNTGCLGRLPMVLSNLHTIKTFNCLILSDLAKTMEVSTSLTSAMHPGVSETNAQHSGSHSEAFANNHTTYTCTFSGQPSISHTRTQPADLCVWECQMTMHLPVWVYLAAAAIPLHFMCTAVDHG